MIRSKHNIISRVKNSDSHFVVNLLTGQADLLTSSEAESLTITPENIQRDESNIENFIKNGYLTTPENEKRLYKNRYFDFIDQRDEEEIQLFFVPNYSCNFACTYCYQDEYTNPNQIATPEIVNAFFEYLKGEFANRRKYITIFGGEPLLNNARQRSIIELLLDKSKEAGIEICVVTNGYYLEEYIEILKRGLVREIQVTLDGTQQVHDRRRFLKGGLTTFEKIVKGVDLCLDSGISVNMRMVIDKQNVDNLIDLSAFAIEKGWTVNRLFKTQIGRNYELHHCQSTPEQLFTRISLFEKIFQLTEEHPHILEFYRPSYSVAKYLKDNGKLPDPLFDACPACKSEWAFDFTGRIYSCTATVGKEGEMLGTFYPEITKNNALIQEWTSRDVTNIDECKECSLQLACGGGCGSVAKNNHGTVLSPDCRPVKELLEIGFAAWFKEELSD